jgi:TfoX/Sxy family transcriptional regulator of competence genes
MAWVKIPKEHHPLFYAALPKDKRVSTLPMFGGVAAKVNGNMFGGLFGLSAIVRLSDADQTEALALDGAHWFDPMGNGRVSKHSVQLPESVMEDPTELKDWLRRAFDHALTLPAKKAKSAAKTKPAAKKKPASPRASSRKAPSRSTRRST